MPGLKIRVLKDKIVLGYDERQIFTIKIVLYKSNNGQTLNLENFGKYAGCNFVGSWSAITAGIFQTGEGWNRLYTHWREMFVGF